MGHTAILLFCAYSLPFISTEPYSILNYNSGAGIYYENIGEANIYLKDFNLVTFYDLKEYYTSYKMGAKHIDEMRKVCASNASDNEICRMLLSSYTRSAKALEHRHKLISDLTGTRTTNVKRKRSFLTTAKQTAKEFFGITSMEQRAISAEIQKYRQEVTNLRSMTSQQMYLYQNLQTDVNREFADISRSIDQQANNISVVGKKLAMDIFEKKIVSMGQTIYTLIQILSTQQSELLDCLILARQGILHPIIISPRMLEKKLLEAKELVTTNPAMAEILNLAAQNANSIFNMLKPMIYVENETIVFDLKVPLIGESLYEVYKITSAPVSITKDIYAYIYPEHPYLFVDKKNERHFFLDKRDFDECRSIAEKQYVCRRLKPLFVKQSTCEHILISNNENIPENCDLRLVRIDRTLFIELESDGSWIFVSPNWDSLQLYCDQKKIRSNITGTGILNVNYNCESTETNDIILRDYSTNNFNISHKYRAYQPNADLKKHLQGIDTTRCPQIMHRMVLSRSETVKLKEIGTPLATIQMLNTLDTTSMIVHNVILYIVCAICIILLCITAYLFLSLRTHESFMVKNNLYGRHVAVTENSDHQYNPKRGTR